MQKKMPLVVLLIIVAGIAVLHVVGLRFYLYWQLSWYDSLVHVLGGFWISFGIVSYFATKASISRISSILLLGLGAAIVIGLAWEIFELAAGVTALADPGYWADTTADMMSDIVGGLLAVWYYRSSHRLSLQ